MLTKFLLAYSESLRIFKRNGIPNLFLNTGHGTLGWTMACGSGHVVADCVMGTSTAIALDGLGVERYTNGSAPR